jgi:uncharacterized protein (TIGR02996 family)
MTFHPEELALLAAIHQEPLCDTARLVYADWLQENGQADYADYIRKSCAEPNAWPCFATADQLVRWAKPIPRGFDQHFERGLPITWLHPNRCSYTRLDDTHRRMSPRVGVILMMKETTLLHPVVGTDLFAHPIMARVHRLRVVPAPSDSPLVFIKRLASLPLPRWPIEINFAHLHAEAETAARTAFASYHVTIDYISPARQRS